MHPLWTDLRKICSNHIRDTVRRLKAQVKRCFLRPIKSVMHSLYALISRNDKLGIGDITLSDLPRNMLGDPVEVGEKAV